MCGWTDRAASMIHGAAEEFVMVDACLQSETVIWQAMGAYFAKTRIQFTSICVISVIYVIYVNYRNDVSYVNYINHLTLLTLIT